MPCETRIVYGSLELLIHVRQSKLPPKLRKFYSKAKNLDIFINLCGLLMDKCRILRRRFKLWTQLSGSQFQPLNPPLGMPSWDFRNVFRRQMGTLSLCKKTER